MTATGLMTAQEFLMFIPDVVWYRDSRVPGRDDPVPCAAPDLAVEVHSPSTWR